MSASSGYRTWAASCALGLLVACSDGDRAARPLAEAALSTEPALRLNALASRVGQSSKGCIEPLSDGYRISAKAAHGRLDLDLDASGSLLRVALGTRTIELKRIGGQASKITLEDDTLHLAGSAGSSTALFFALGDRIEELLHVPSRDSVVGYDFELAGGLTLHNLPGPPPMLELADASGRPLLRVTFQRSWDADGKEWPVQLNLDGARVRFTLPDGARFPVVIDPAMVPADTMSTARFRHSATLLLDGKLLLAGGATEAAGSTPGLGSSPSASAELYDPVSGLFETVGALTHARWGHTATLLRDGRVLIVGGVDEQGAALASAELYDPEKKRFRDAGDLSHARALHTATLLADDRVLLLGGIYDLTPGAPRPPYPYVYESVVSHAEAYQPKNGSFADLGTVPGVTFPHAAALLEDGSVAVAWPRLPVRAKGGVEPIQSVSLARFEPQHNLFTSTGEVVCNDPCQDILLRYEAGSVDTHPPRLDVITAAEEIQFEPSTGKVGQTDHVSVGSDPVQATSQSLTLFENSGSGSSAEMAFGSALRVLDGVIGSDGPAPVLAGGWRSSLGNSDTSWLLTQDAKNITPVPQTGICDCAPGFACVTLPHGNAPVCARETWLGTGLLAVGRAWPTVTSLPSGDALAIGGMADVPLRSADELSIAGARSTFAHLAVSPGIVISPVSGLDDAISLGHATTLLGDGRVLFTGGYNKTKFARTWLPTAPTLVPAGPPRATEEECEILAQRARHQSFLLPSGQVLLAGGETSPAQANEELFNPMSGTSKYLGFRLQARHSGLALSGNRFLFASQEGLELLDANDFSVHTIVAQELGCAAPGLARLLNGHVAVVGHDSMFELDLKQRKLSAAVPLGTPRCDAALAVLPDGTLAIAGGSSEGATATTALEIYDPKTLRLSALGRLFNPAAGARAVVRFSNLVLLGGLQDAAPAQMVKWASGAVSGVFTNQAVSNGPSMTTLADGGILLASAPDHSNSQVDDAPERIDLMTTDPSDLKLDAPPLEVTPGQAVQLSGLNFSKTWPENSGGTTQGSATNAPVAIWIPVLDGWPVTGTFSAWSEERATWQVPHPAFPGLGILGYVRSGTLHPLRLVRIGELGNGAVCVESSECGSGYCVEGVCCERACDGACEACGGADGICGPTPEGSSDMACKTDDPKTCGQDGLCDGTGACELYPDGHDCAKGAACSGGICTKQPDKTATTCDGNNKLIASDGNNKLIASDATLPTTCPSGFRCSLRTNACLKSCASSGDCVEGLLCNSMGQCQKRFDQPQTSLGCAPGCRIASGNSRTSELWGLGIGLLAAALRRRSRRTRAATTRSAP